MVSRLRQDEPVNLGLPGLKALPDGASTAVDVAQRYAEEAINRKHLDLVDELFAPDAVCNDPWPPGRGTRS